MVKARKVLKYTAAGAVTTLYAGGIYVVLTGIRTEKPDPAKVATTGAAMLAMTWAAILL